MNKYIEENTLIEHLTKMLVTMAVNSTGYKTYVSNVCRDIAVNRLSVWLEFAPVADVVEVVRCKDCKYLNDGYCYYWDDEYGVPIYYDNGYCSNGKRREDVRLDNKS